MGPDTEEIVQHDPARRPMVATALIGVYDDEDGATQVADRLRQQPDVDDGMVRIGRDRDVVASLQAEMGEEIGRSWVAPQAGMVFQKQAVKDMLFLLPIFGLVGAILGVPFAFLDFSSLTMTTRLILFPILGILFSTTVAAIAIPALAAPSAHEPSAAQRGTVVRVDRWTPELEALMRSAAPLRLDQVGPGDVLVSTVETEEDRRPGGALEELGRTVVDEVTGPAEDRDR
jgi:hypothetical protein